MVTLLLVLTLSFTGSAAFAGNGSSWEMQGPYGQWDTRVLSAAGDRPTLFTGGFESTDDGAHWSPLGHAGSVVAADPLDPGRLDVFTGTGYLHETTDGGATWHRRRFPLRRAQFLSMAIDPGAPQTIYWGDLAGGLYRSTGPADGWTRFLPNFRAYQIVVDPVRHRFVYVAGYELDGRHARRQLWRSTDFGTRWRQMHGRPSVVVVDPSDSHVLFGISTRHGVIESTDRGDHWTTVRSLDGVYNQVHTSILADPSRPGRFYADGEPDVRTDDGGGHWVDLADFEGRRVDLQTVSASGRLIGVVVGSGVVVSDDGGATWSAADEGLRPIGLSRISTGPGDPGIVYVSNDYWLWRSTSSGEDWHSLQDPGGAIAVGAGRPPQLVPDPASPSTVYLEGDAGVVRSTDQGNTWEPLTEDCCSFETWFAVAPSDPETLYVDRRYDLGPGGPKGIDTGRSIDGGATWQGVAQTTGPLFVDPTDPATVYSAASDSTSVVNANLRKSTNGAESWQRADQGLPGAVRSLAIDPADPDTLYATVCGDQPGVFRSADGARSWDPLPQAPEACGFLAIDPAHPERIALAPFAPGRSVMWTQDGGDTWGEACGDLPPTVEEVTDVAFDAAGTVLRAATSGGEAVCRTPA